MIPFEIADAIQILSRTPRVLREMLSGLDDKWLYADEGVGTWTPHGVIAHLIFGEQTDWIPSMQIILGDQRNKNFIPFDREGHLSLAKGRTIESLLHQFEQIRKENIDILQAADIISDDFSKTGIHPAFGEVTLSQLLAAWVVHDMTHIVQISRVIATQYVEEVGPWKEYMGVIKMG
ncbi:MAG: DinB family protein [Saprospiraceae bacterium]